MGSGKQVDTKELVQAAIDGDSDAYETLYNATAPQMLGLARSMLRQEEDAMDMLQESYLYAFKSLGSLQQPEYFGTWLYQIVSNRCKNFLTRTRPKLFAASITDEEGEDFEYEDSDISFHPQESTENVEIRRIVWEMVDSLPEDQRACVLLYYFQEMKVGEIARLLEISENTVKSRLSYARKKLLSKAEELERKGTVLHGFTFFPIMGLAAKQAVDQAMAASGTTMVQSIMVEVGAAGIATGTTAAAGTGSAASAGPGAAIQAFVGTAAGKATAAVVALSLLAGGIAIFTHKEQELPVQPESAIVEPIIEPEPVMVSEPEPESASESEPEPEPEPEPPPALPTPYSQWEGSVPDSNGGPADQYNLHVLISGNVEVYKTDLENGDIYIRLSVGDEFTIELDEVGRDLKNYKRSWNIGKLSKTLKQIEHDTFVKIYQGEKAGSGTMTASWSDNDHSVTCKIHVTVE